MEVPVLLLEAVGHLPVETLVSVCGRHPVDDQARLGLHLDRGVIREVYEFWSVVVHVFHLGDTKQGKKQTKNQTLMFGDRILETVFLRNVSLR